jgi:protein-tyrosine phosphatase
MLGSRPEVLVVCTANVCRSPMAQALLTSRLAALGQDAAVRSGGVMPGGEPALPEAIAAMARYGIDIAAHRSRQVTASDLERADVILAMARENLRHAVVTAPAAWPRAFTLTELVRRGAAAGCRLPGEGLDGWLARAHEGRRRSALLGDSGADDVADPAGGPRRGYDQTAAVLSRLIGQLVRLCWQVPGPVPPPPEASRPGRARLR